MWEQEIHSLINATFAPRPVRCTYHVARSELCLLHKPHQINIPSRPRSSNGLILAILPNGKHAPRPLRARFRSTVPSLAGVARSWRAPCSRLAWPDSSAELGLSNSGAAKTFAQGACSQAISTPDARMDDGVATALGRRGVAWSERDRAVRRQLPAELSSCLALLLRIGPPLPAARRPEL